jgi:type IV pilus assembly protein PilW
MEPRPVISRSLPRQRGLTLIELMISITIGMIVLSALTYIYVGARGAYRSNENLARLQENGRFALDFLAKDLRMGGYSGCSSYSIPPTRIAVVARPAPGITPGWATANLVVTGFEDGTGWVNPSNVARLRGDVITLRRAISVPLALDQNTDQDDATVTIRNNCPSNPFKQGDLMVIATCERMSVVRVTNTPAQACTTPPTAVVIEHHPTDPSDASRGNGNNGLTTPYPDPNSHWIPVMKVDDRPQVMRFQEITYFLGANAAGRPSLYRHVGDAAPEELVENVEDFDVLYGIDTSGDRSADEYRRADQIVGLDWGNVVAVRLALLVSGPDTSVATSTQTYALRDSDGDGLADTESAADSRLRQVFTATIALRNKVD